MEYIVYVLKSINKDFTYTGMTKNIERRLNEHNTWKNKSTKAYKPFTIIYQKEYKNSIEARKNEKYLKWGKWKKRIKENFL